MANPNSEILEWEVKPKFTVYWPSVLTGSDTQSSTSVFGLNSMSGDIMRNWEKIHSVEQHNQGYKKLPSDFTFTLVVKEQTTGFEVLRRLGISGTWFDVEASLIITDGESHEYASKQWMDGFIKFLGCVVQNERESVEIGDIPTREFECEALQHRIKKSTSANFNDSTQLDEGLGTMPDHEINLT